jgi:hypothetical protein
VANPSQSSATLPAIGEPIRKKWPFFARPAGQKSLSLPLRFLIAGS